MKTTLLLVTLFYSACGATSSSGSESTPAGPVTRSIELVAEYADQPVPDGMQTILASLQVRIDGETFGTLPARGGCEPSPLPEERAVEGAIASVVCSLGVVSRWEIWFTSDGDSARAHVQRYSLSPDGPSGAPEEYVPDGEPFTLEMEGVQLAPDATVTVRTVR